MLYGLRFMIYRVYGLMVGGEDFSLQVMSPGCPAWLKPCSLTINPGCPGLAPWAFEFPFPGSLTSTFLVGEGNLQVMSPGCPARGRRRG